MKKILYKKNFEEVIERLTSFYNQQAEDRIFVSFNPPSKSLKEFAKKYANEYVSYPDPHERLEFWSQYLHEKIELEDDSIPSVYLSQFDQGLYGALIGGKMQYLADPNTGLISSMIKPLYNEITEFEPTRLEFDSQLYGRYLTELKLYADHSENKFGIGHFILIDSLNFVFELVGGTKTYLSIFDYPEKVKEAIDFAHELNVKVFDDFFSLIPSYRGGTFSYTHQWLPGRVLFESIDPFHLASVDYFEEWGREPVERILSRYDGGALHIHSNGRHLLRASSSIKGLKGFHLLDERGAPPAFDVLDDLKKETGKIPVLVNTTDDKFIDKLNKHQLPGNVLYLVDTEKDTKEINEIMKKVKQYKA